MSTVARLSRGQSLLRSAMAATVLVVAGVMFALGSNQASAAPLAGTTIGNQAAASYTDASSIPRNVTSNTVNTVVQQVASFTLTASQTKTSAPSSPISFSHTITNTGNGPDSFNLAVTNNVGDNFDLSGLAVYADTNCDGVAEGVITSVGPLAAFTGAACVVVQGTVPAVLAGNQALITLTGTSVFNNTVTQSNTDTVNVTGNAVVNITGKAISAPSGNPGTGPYTYTITFTNTGAATAQNVIIGDVVPAGMTYAAGSGRWSGTGATVLTDANNADNQSGIIYDYNVTTAGAVTAVIASLAPNTTQTLTFQVNVPISTPPGVINNTARLCYTDNTTGGVQVPLTCSAANVTTTGSVSNTVPFTVNQLASVVANNHNNSTANGAPDNTVTVASAAQGATVSFDNYIWNLGNGADSFTITVSPGAPAFPAGTTFQLFQQDGVTPLVGNTTPSIPASNTGTCSPANATTNGFVQDGVGRCGYRVVLRATLPGAATGGPFNVIKTATSVFNNTVSDPVTDSLTAITSSTVDLRNGAANTLGTGIGPEASPVTTNTVNPGSSTTFVLKVNNTVGPADTYNLAASTDNTFATTVLPAGWTVTFRADGGVGDCTTTGAVISNTGVVNSGANVTVCATIAVPANAAAAAAPGTSIFFRALSPSTGVLDRKHDAVIVNTVRNITFTANNSGQVFPGGSVVYTHTITNNGNVVEGAAAAPAAGSVGLAGVMSGATASWAFAVYWDKNNDGVLDAGDPAITDLSVLTGGTGGASTAAGLDPGESARLFVRVTAPAGAAIGDTNVVTLTATTTGTINTVAAPPAVAVTDTTQVISGQVRLTKTQALDANCDGVPDGPFVQTPITTGAIPGACIRYSILIENQGTATVTTLIVSDATPANTTYHTGGGTAPAAVTGAGNSVTAPANGATGTIQATIPTLVAGASQTLTFGVRIDP